MTLTTDELEHPRCSDTLDSLRTQLNILEAEGAKSGTLYYMDGGEIHELPWTEEILWETLSSIVPNTALNIFYPVFKE